MLVSLFPRDDCFGSNMYVLSDGGEAAIVDPSVEYSKVSGYLKNRELKVKYIIVTHSHFDHILAIDSWKQNTNAEVIVGRYDAAALSDSSLNCYHLFLGENLGYDGEYRTVSEGDVLSLGNTEISIYETPGHSAGSITLCTSNMLFTGDLVFEGGGFGRCDLPGGNYITLSHSIERLKTFPPDTEIYPGHGSKIYVREI